jgi:hypothetical protein
VAGCTGSRFRRLGLPVVALGVVTASAMAQAPVPAAPVTATASAAPTAEVAQTQERHGKKMNKDKKVENPDAALLEYLGEYGDAADGLDPMGLADPDAPVVKTGDGKGGQGNQ